MKIDNIRGELAGISANVKTLVQMNGSVAQASILKDLAERFQISVVVTNQLTARDNSGEVGGASSRAALGIVWAHAVNTRIILEQQANNRVLRV